MPRDRGVTQALGASLTRRIKCSRVLLVGAGGIGCEVLKNLVCCGFGSASPPPVTATNTFDRTAALSLSETRKPEIVVVDLDTIDLSNLNRQFLFRKHHVKQPKAFVAKETASRFNPNVNIDAQHANIFDARYDVDFFATFDVVFNALDNLAARRHVNRTCLAANVPLIESGTTGYNGQVQAIRKGVTECYDCNPKPVQKTFPICTIRSTPSQPIHCIVWAKSYLFPELFGTSEEESADVEVTAGDNAEEVAKLREEAQALKNIRSLMGQSEFAQAVFDKVFHDDIERLRSMREMWQSRKPPTSLSFSTLLDGTAAADLVKEGRVLTAQDQRTWTLRENLAVFCYSLDVISSRHASGETVIEFDKDDKDTLDFVTSTANLRSEVFGIEQHSEWDIKQMAGNIIPAIATSNAMTASLCVLQAFKIIRSLSDKTAHISNRNGIRPPETAASGRKEGLLGGAKMVFLSSKSTARMLTAQNLSPPNPACPVCSPVYSKVHLNSTASPKLQDLVNTLRGKVGHAADFSITTDAGLIFDPDLEDNLEKPLSELGVSGSGFITVADEDDEPNVDLVLSVSSQPPASGAAVELPQGDLVLPKKPAKPTQTSGEANGHVEAVPARAASETNGKRKRTAEDVVEGPAKKARPAPEGEVFEIADSGGAIVLED